MTARTWVPTMLRARQAKEDLAAQQVAIAYRDVREATAQHAEHTARVIAMVAPRLASGADFQAAATSSQAAAATLAAAGNRVTFAEARVDTNLVELTEAARSRRTVEKLHERDVAEAAELANAKAQRESDDVSISRHGAEQRRAAS